MKTVIERKFCQNLSKLQDKIEEVRRENGRSGEDSQPLRKNSINHPTRPVGFIFKRYFI